MRQSVMLATAAVLCAVALQALCQTSTLPGSPDQARDVISVPGAAPRTVVWGAKSIFQLNFDQLHAAGEPAVRVDPQLAARNREARDRSIALARSGMMERYAAREAQESAVGAGAPSHAGDSAR